MYYSSNIIWVTKSRRMTWEGHVACTGGEERCIQSISGEA